MNGLTPVMVLHGALALLLAYAAFGDVRARIIPNWLVIAIAAFAPVLWWVSGMSLWPDIAIQIGVAIGFLVLFSIFFALNAMGGGDVKLIAALALWFPVIAFLQLLMVMSIVGGIITLGMWVREKVRKSGKNIEVPYGVAISVAGIWAIHERYLNHFG
jgi:prepilin peptidase CpaA